MLYKYTPLKMIKPTGKIRKIGRAGRTSIRNVRSQIYVGDTVARRDQIDESGIMLHSKMNIRFSETPKNRKSGEKNEERSN